MVKILPKVPGFGERLGAALGGGLGGGFQQGISKAQEFANQIQLEKEKRKLSVEDLGPENEILKQNYGIDLTGIKDPATRKIIISEGIKQQGAAREEEKATKGITHSLDWLEDNIKYSGKFGVAPKWGGIEAQGESGGLALKNPATGKPMTNLEIQAKREEIDRTGIWMADAIYTHFNKGVLNKDKWNDVKERFATDSQLPASINRARMASARRIMGLPKNAPTSVVEKTINSELKALDKIESSKNKKELPPLESFYE
jgi:hypothetical protein